jgi:GTP:adenosylcobinamide-phosphate guanylyltransferase
MDAVILACGEAKGALARRENVRYRTLLTLRGTTLVERVIRAVRACPEVDRVCVVGPPELEPLARQAGAEFFRSAAPADSAIASMLRASEILGSRGCVLCIASDLPFLTSQDVSDVVRRAPVDAHFTVTVCKRRDFQTMYPQGHATFHRFREGWFAGGGLYLLNIAALGRVAPLAEAAFAARKHPLLLARLVGWKLVLHLAAAPLLPRVCRPSLVRLRRLVERRLGHACAVMRSCSPRIAADVDDWADWRFAQRLLERQGQAPVLRADRPLTALTPRKEVRYGYRSGL